MIEGTGITAKTGVVSTGPAEGARVGVRIFEAGGNAMDAAAAACLACAVLEPQAVDLGGYVAAGVLIEGSTGRVWSLDANSVAPAAASEDMYEVLPPEPGKRGINELEYGCSVRNDANVYGPLSVAVPGFLAGVGTLHERWGRLKWPEIVRPARDLVESALHYGLVLESVKTKRDAIERFPSAAEILLPGGNLPDAAQRWHRPGLARTLDRLSAAGWRDFYDGEIGRAIADFVTRAGGILSRGDMASFEPRITEPYSGAYRGVPIYTAIEPNGGFSTLQALAELGEKPPLKDTTVEYWHEMAELLKRMWRRRLGAPAGASKHGTIHVASADCDGNLVSITISQGGLFGSCLAVPGTGIILAHGMCRFDPHAGLPNSPGPKKRPLNNVCPMILRLPDRDVAIGARGGRRIVSVAVQFAQRIIDQRATTYQAASAPRLHALTDEPVEISHNFDPAMRQALEALGHRVEVPNEVAGAAHGAEILKSSGLLRAGGNTHAAGI